MCGIVGYAGKKEALPVLLRGLERLEYRGYDSAGISVAGSGGLQTVKRAGKLTSLKEALEHWPVRGTAGIAHTRWATHGVPSDRNAHPHQDCTGRLAVVHNGIIENAGQLRQELQERGHRFSSDTDSEVISHLLEEGGADSLVRTMQRQLAKVKGSYGLLAMLEAEPSKVVAARRESPLVIGFLEGGDMMAASDVAALLPFTREVLYLLDGDVAELSAGSVAVVDEKGNPAVRPVERVEWGAGQAEKAGHEHFMLKEIMEAPEIIEATAKRLVSGDEELHLALVKLSKARRVTVTGCGTAYHASMMAAMLLEMAGSSARAEIASEFRYRDPLMEKEDLLWAISQSGETADTLAALRLAKSRGVGTLAMVNAPGSSLAREAEGALANRIGPEISVCSTKAFLSQYLLIALLASKLAKKNEVVPALQELSRKAGELLQQQDQILEVAKRCANAKSMLFLGRGLNHPLALEGALKLKEISYMHAEGYPAGELKHGPLALVDESWPVLTVIPRDRWHDKTLSNLREVKARGAQVLAVATEGDGEVEDLVDAVLWAPKTHEWLQPVLSILPLQLFAYHAARLRGCPIDQPRNLAKSVTVE